MKRVLAVLTVLLTLPFVWLWWTWPPPVWYKWRWPATTAFMSIRNAEARAQGLEYEKKYLPVGLEAISPHLKAAVMAGEDQRFYDHGGIDFVEFRKAIGYRRDSFSWSSARDRKALLAAIRSARTRTDGMRGASTITQQLAKNLYLSPSRSTLRKLKEAVTAWRLEYWLGKERILELYLNVAEFGPGLWGAEAASQHYFKKSAARLTLDEAAALAGTLPFPLRSNPEYQPSRMRWRQNMILRWLRGEPVEIPPAPDIPIDSVPALPDTIPIDTIPKPDTIPLSRGQGEGRSEKGTAPDSGSSRKPPSR